jgi:hypothetical protein
MTWLFPEPQLGPGEGILWKAKAVLVPDAGGKQPTVVIYLTNQHLFFVPGRGFKGPVLGFPRGDWIGVRPEEGRFGYSAAQGLWKKMRLTFSHNRSVLVFVRRRDQKVEFLRRELSRR